MYYKRTGNTHLVVYFGVQNSRLIVRAAGTVYYSVTVFTVFMFFSVLL